MLDDFIYKEKESEFLKLIEEIDEGFKEQNVPILHHSIRTIREICIRLKISLPIIPYGSAIPRLYLTQLMLF